MSRMPFRRSLVPSRAGSSLFRMQTVRSVLSTNPISVSNWQPSQTSGHAALPAVRSKRPVTAAPRNRIPAVPPGAASAAPSSSAAMTSARITGGPAAPEPRSTHSPPLKAFHSNCSGSVRSAGFTHSL